MRIAVLPGDGVGPEVTAQAVKALRAVAANGAQFEMAEALIGDAAFDAAGDPLPPETLETARQADAILFGAAGTYESDLRPPESRGGHGLLRLRKALDLFANFRPVYASPELLGASTLRREVVEGVDLVVLRELTGDIYFGTPRGVSSDADGQRVGTNTMRYTEAEIARVAHAGFRAARGRRGKLCSVDKANVLETSLLWREVVTEVARDYPDVELRHEYVDAAAMHLIRRPRDFDVIVTGNIFGDILSDAAAMLTGSIGMLPSASLGEGGRGLYEPVHGSAPDIAGTDVANPLASILSAAMLLRHSGGQEAAAALVERAVRRVLAEGYRTADIMEPGATRLGTEAMGDAVAAAIGKDRA
jgi:3-isopropylmalate dehydrogenase